MITEVHTFNDVSSYLARVG